MESNIKMEPKWERKSMEIKTNTEKKECRKLCWNLMPKIVPQTSPGSRPREGDPPWGKQLSTDPLALEPVYIRYVAGRNVLQVMISRSFSTFPKSILKFSSSPKCESKAFWTFNQTIPPNPKGHPSQSRKRSSRRLKEILESLKEILQKLEGRSAESYGQSVRIFRKCFRTFRNLWRIERNASRILRGSYRIP